MTTLTILALGRVRKESFCKIRNSCLAIKTFQDKLYLMATTFGKMKKNLGVDPGVTADLDPPGPDPLADMDPLSRIWIPLTISVSAFD